MANVDAASAAAVWQGGSRRAGQATVHHEGLIDVASIVVEPAADPTRER